MHKMIHERPQTKASEWITDKNTRGQGHNLSGRNSRGNLLSLLSQRSLPERGQQEAENCYTTPTGTEVKRIVYTHTICLTYPPQP